MMVARARVGAIRLSELLDKTGVKDMEVPWMMSISGMGNCIGSWAISINIGNNGGRASFRGKIMSSVLDMLTWGARQ